jgi:hypothetical protein
MRPAIARPRFGAWSGVLRLALVVMLAAGILRAGSTYFTCPMMDAISATPCCAHCAADSGDEPAVDRSPCCAREHIRALPSSTTNGAPITIADAPLVAVIDPLSFGAHVPLSVRSDPVRTQSRAGPPPNDTRPARLRVFLL